MNEIDVLSFHCNEWKVYFTHSGFRFTTIAPLKVLFIYVDNSPEINKATHASTRVNEELTLTYPYLDTDY